MKRLLLLILIGLWVPALQAEMGAFFVLKSAYFYPRLGGGPKYLTRVKAAYRVVGMEFVGKDKLLYRVLVPTETVSTGSGYIVLTDQQLKERKDELIKIYPEVPSKKTDLTQYTWVPASAVLVSGPQETRPEFPQLAFRAVNYKGAVPKAYWIDDWAGIYRPEKEASWLNQTFQALKQTDLSEDRRERILMGLVEAGYSETEVRQALGEPQSRERLDNGEVQWLYADKKILFKHGKVAQVL